MEKPNFRRFIAALGTTVGKYMLPYVGKYFLPHWCPFERLIYGPWPDIPIDITENLGIFQANEAAAEAETGEFVVR